MTLWLNLFLLLYGTAYGMVDEHRLLMLIAETLIYLKQKLFLSVKHCNNCGTFCLLDINSIQYKFIYTFFPFSALTTLTCVIELQLSFIYDINCPNLVSCLFVCICFACFFSFLTHLNRTELNYYCKDIDVFSKQLVSLQYNLK
jgi:hypothetical protein